MIHDIMAGFRQRVAGAACLFLLFMSHVEGRNIVQIARSCTDYQRLVYDPTITKIVVVGMIVMRDCVWGDEPIPKRELIFSGEGSGVLDYRGMNESIYLASGLILRFSHITLISDTVMPESYEWAQSRGEEVHVRLEQSVLRFSKCIQYMPKHPWLMSIKGSNNIGQDSNICGLENGGIMLNKVDLPASGGITVYLRETEMACDDFGAESLKYFEFKPCQKGVESGQVLSSSTALKVFGSLCIILPFIIFVLCFYILFFCLARKRSTTPQDNLLPEAEAIPSSQNDDGFVALEDIHLGAVIGKGGFSTVYHATLSDKQVAVKVFENREPSSVEKESCEALVSSTIIHPNIVRCIAHRTCDWNKCPSGYGATNCYNEEDSLSSDVSDAFDFVEMASPSPGGNCTRTWLIMEYCNMGSMYNAIKNATFHECPDRSVPNLKQIIAAALDVAQAMQHLHAVGVIHGDLKSQNVLLQASDSDERGYVCKVGDFGFSRLAINSTHIQTFTCGSVRAMPPEVLKDGFLTPAADVYSFGILLWELLRGRPPYQGWCHQTILHNVVHGRRPRVPDEWPRGLASLVRDCLGQARTLRPSFTAIVERLHHIDVKQSVRAHDEPDCPINSELEDVFFSCSCCTEDNDTLQIPQTLGFEPRKLSGFVIGVDSSEGPDQNDEELCEKEGRNLWMGANWL